MKFLQPTQAQQRVSQRNLSWRARKKTRREVHSPLIQTSQRLALVCDSSSLSLQTVLLSLGSKPPFLILPNHPTFPSVTHYLCDFERHLAPFVLTRFAWEYLLWRSEWLSLRHQPTTLFWDFIYLNRKKHILNSYAAHWQEPLILILVPLERLGWPHIENAKHFLGLHCENEIQALEISLWRLLLSSPLDKVSWGNLNVNIIFSITISDVLERPQLLESGVNLTTATDLAILFSK